MPDEIETYTHRSGRTGRAGKEGISMVIVSKSEARKIKQIEKIIQQKFQKKEIPSGMEICEKQLMHLANNIKETEINHDIDVYLPQIDEALKDFSKEELIKKFFSVEFTRFYNYYQKAKDLNVIAGDPSTSENKDSVRFFLNVGSRDDFNWMSLKDFLKDLLSLGQDEVYKVDVKDNFSFFNVDTKHKELVEGIFTDFQMDGRNVNVEISTDTGRGGGGRKGGRGGRSGRDSRSFKGKDRGRRGDDKRGRRGDDRKSKGGGFKKSGDSGDEFKSKFSGKRRGKSKPESKGTGGKSRRG